VNAFFVAFAQGIALLRIVFFGTAVVVAGVCAIDWLVRTRRINPFGAVARFFRASVDPLLVPIERRVVRAGGMPTSAPWWALVAVVLGGIIVLEGLRFLFDQLFRLTMLASAGPTGVVMLIISAIFTILRVAILVRVIVSWTPISPYSRWVRWAFTVSEPVLAPLRRVIPTLGAVDITPLVAYFLLGILESIIVR
jgi:YggT family protein